MLGPPESKSPPPVAAGEGPEAQTGEHHVSADDTPHLAEFRAKRMATQRAIAGILRKDATDRFPDKWPGEVYRVVQCLWCRAAQVEVMKSAEHGRAHYKGLQTCGSVWVCPCCASKVEERRRQQIEQVFTWADSEKLDSSLHTNTFPHGMGDKLAALLGDQADALKHFRQDKTYRKLMKEIGYVGMVRTLETMWGDINGWHPHTHELKFHREQLSGDDVKWFRHRLVEVWQASCTRTGLFDPKDPADEIAFYQHSMDIRPHFTCSDYMQKTDQSKHWTPAHELAKASTKKGRRSGIHPFQLAVRGHPGDPDRFVEYARAMKGRRKLLFSPGLLKKAGVQDMSDEEIAALDDDAANRIADVTKVWGFIKATDRAHNTRAKVLDAAERAGKDGIAHLLQDLGFDPTKEY